MSAPSEPVTEDVTQADLGRLERLEQRMDALLLRAMNSGRNGGWGNQRADAGGPSYRNPTGMSMSQLRKENRCFKCGKQGHKASECRRFQRAMEDKDFQ